MIKSFLSSELMFVNQITDFYILLAAYCLVGTAFRLLRSI
jgi:hypothetical protein